jgi:hypothetical protein
VERRRPTEVSTLSGKIGDVPVPADVSPDGTDNWLFQVTGFFR